MKAFVVEMKNVLSSNDSLIKVQHLHEHLLLDFVNLFEKKSINLFQYFGLTYFDKNISFKVNKFCQINFNQNLMILEYLKLKILDF